MIKTMKPGFLNRNDVFNKFGHFTDQAELKFSTLLDVVRDSLEKVEGLKGRENVANELAQRGLESLEQVRIDDISIEQIVKRAPEEPRIGYHENILEIHGKIKLDSFLLTDTMEEFAWRATADLTDLDPAGSGLVPHLQFTYFIDFDQQGPSDTIETQDHLNYRQGSLGGSRFLNQRQAQITEKLGLQRVKRKIVYKPVDIDIGYGKSLGVEKTQPYRAINQKINQTLRNFIHDYVSKNFYTEKLKSWYSLKTRFNVETDISSRSEHEITKMYERGLETGEFNEMLLYVGDGAQAFLDILRNEDYQLNNKEQKLLREHSKEVSQQLIDTEIYDLGPGDGRKAKEILLSLQDKEKRIIYHPVDINPTMIYATSVTLRDLSQIDINGLITTFSEVKNKVGTNKNSFLLLGGTLGNGDESYQVDLLNNICQAMKDDEKLIVGLEMRTDLNEIAKSYQQPEITLFVKKSVDRLGITPDEVDLSVYPSSETNEIVLELVFKQDKEVNYYGKRKSYKQGEAIKIIVSHKYEVKEIEHLFNRVKLQIIKQIDNEKKDYKLIILEKQHDM